MRWLLVTPELRVALWHLWGHLLVTVHSIYSEKGPRIALLSPQRTQHLYILRDLVLRDAASRSARGRILWVLRLLCAVVLATGSYRQVLWGSQGQQQLLMQSEEFLERFWLTAPKGCFLNSSFKGGFPYPILGILLVYCSLSLQVAYLHFICNTQKKIYTHMCVCISLYIYLYYVCILK